MNIHKLINPLKFFYELISKTAIFDLGVTNEKATY